MDKVDQYLLARLPWSVVDAVLNMGFHGYQVLGKFPVLKLTSQKYLLIWKIYCNYMWLKWVCFYPVETIAGCRLAALRKPITRFSKMKLNIFGDTSQEKVNHSRSQCFLLVSRVFLVWIKTLLIMVYTTADTQATTLRLCNIALYAPHNVSSVGVF